MRGPFDVRRSDLERHGGEAAVDLVGDIVRMDAIESGIGLNLVNMPAPTRAGGSWRIDGEVDGAAIDGRYGIVKRGITRYMVRSERRRPSRSSMEKMLLAGPGEVKSGIRRCLDSGGTLVVALAGWDDPRAAESEAADGFREVLKCASGTYGTASVEVWSQNTIIGFLESLPALRLEVTSAPRGSYYTLDEWSGHADMGMTLHLGAGQRGFVDDLRGRIRGGSGPAHVRVLGEPGIGKTRLVLEACRAPDIARLVVYVEEPARLEGGGLLAWLAGRISDGGGAVLVVDECDRWAGERIWSAVRQHGPRARLVTLHNEPGEGGRVGREVARVPPLPGAEVGRILSEYGIAGPECLKWTDLCAPSPRAAHMVGESLAQDRGNPFMESDIVSGWERLTASRPAIDSPEHKSRKAVLSWLSIFGGFVYDGGRGEEYEAIRGLVRRFEDMRSGEFRRIVEESRRMGILRGSHTLRIAPKVLSVYLCRDWWRTYGDFDLPEVLKVIGRPEEGGGARGGDAQGLAGRLCRTVCYAGDPEAAGRALRTALDADGLPAGE